MKDRLRNKIAALPEEPGVYLMKGEDGQILYVGKAKNLNKRVRSYFEGGGHGGPPHRRDERYLPGCWKGASRCAWKKRR